MVNPEQGGYRPTGGKEKIPDRASEAEIYFQIVTTPFALLFQLHCNEHTDRTLSVRKYQTKREKGNMFLV